jgi:hypothetical protein
MQMMKIFACVAVLLSARPQVEAAPQAAPSPDQSLQSAITTSVSSDESLKHFYINVWVKSGFVSLTGLVQTPAQYDRATEVAKAAGAASVSNTIIVNPAAKTKEEMEKLMNTPAETAKPKEPSN